MLACASKPPPAQNRCPPNKPGCQVELFFSEVGLGERVARVDGRLTAEYPTATYIFNAGAGDTLRLKAAGVPMRLTLTRPNGQTVGPGVPPELVLGPKGKYTLRVGANSTADDAYGEFHLEIRVTEKQ